MSKILIAILCLAVSVYGRSTRNEPAQNSSETTTPEDVTAQDTESSADHCITTSPPDLSENASSEEVDHVPIPDQSQIKLSEPFCLNFECLSNLKDRTEKDKQCRVMSKINRERWCYCCGGFKNYLTYGIVCRKYCVKEVSVTTGELTTPCTPSASVVEENNQDVGESQIFPEIPFFTNEADINCDGNGITIEQPITTTTATTTDTTKLTTKPRTKPSTKPTTKTTSKTTTEATTSADLVRDKSQLNQKLKEQEKQLDEDQIEPTRGRPQQEQQAQPTVDTTRHAPGHQQLAEAQPQAQPRVNEPGHDSTVFKT